jgi:lipopolysaccharide transport system ATP-binding protein
MKPIIEVKNISKKYYLGMLGSTSIRELLNSVSKNLKDKGALDLIKFFSQRESERDHIWALKDVSFTVQPGEIVGLIGRNGCGKSTLLRILSRITFPTEGRAVIRGKSSALLEVGTGFHAELSGRENIFLNGAILGMRKREIERKFDAIVDFSEIEKFIDTPIKHYSSGMYVRLAFSVAAHLEQPILFVDEVLAVGDSAFQSKCIDKMKSVAKSGRTILFVSHDDKAVRRLCNRGIYLKQGRVVATGPTSEMLELYSGERQFENVA